MSLYNKEQRPPDNNGHKFWVPSVVVAHRFDCICYSFKLNNLQKRKSSRPKAQSGLKNPTQWLNGNIESKIYQVSVSHYLFEVLRMMLIKFLPKNMIFNCKFWSYSLKLLLYNLALNNQILNLIRFFDQTYFGHSVLVIGYDQ